jgi:hypothetical protein
MTTYNIMHYVFWLWTRVFHLQMWRPPSRFLILKNWSNKVNGIQSNFKKYVYICVEFYNYENDYIHKNGIVAKHILLHDYIETLIVYVQVMDTTFWHSNLRQIYFMLFITHSSLLYLMKTHPYIKLK